MSSTSAEMPVELELGGGGQTKMHRCAPGDERDIRALTHGARASERQRVVANGDRSSHRAIEALRLHEQNRVRISYRHAQHVPCIIGKRRTHDLDAGRLRELQLDGVGMELGSANAASIRSTDGHRHRIPASRPGPEARELRPDLVEGLVGEAEKLDLGNGNHPADRQAHRRADYRSLGERGVEHAVSAEMLLEPLSYAEHAAERSHVHPEDNDTLIAGHLREKRRSNRLEDRHVLGSVRRPGLARHGLDIRHGVTSNIGMTFYSGIW